MINAFERIQELARKKELRESGKQTLIPFYQYFPKLSKQIPGLYKQAMITFLAGTGVGKSKFSRYVNVLMPYQLSKQSNLKYKTIYCALEESEDQFIDNMILYVLYNKYNIELDYMELNSYREKQLTDDLIEKIKHCAEEVNEIMKNVYLICDVTNPTGIMMRCKEIARELGTLVEENNKFVSYTPNDPDEFVILVCDHIALLSEEKDNNTGRYLNKREVMQKWSSVYCLKIFTKRFDWIVWNVQQTTMTSEGHERKKTNSLDISIEDAGENKTILRDSSIILSLFSPFEHQINNYLGYNIIQGKTGLKYTFRSLGILKNRFGRKDLKLGLRFEGVTGTFTELDRENQEKYYV